MKHIGKQEFAQLIVQYRQNFYRIAYSYVKNEQDALDIVSEATCKGLAHIKDLREPVYLKTWMTRIVINVALDFLRKNGRQAALQDYVLEDDILPEREPEVNFDLYAALDGLSVEDKSFIILKYFEEYSFKEIARLFKMPESSVKSRVYRCLAKMRSYMEEGDGRC